MDCINKSSELCSKLLVVKSFIFSPLVFVDRRKLPTATDHYRSGNGYYYSTFIHCTNSDFLIGWFVPRDPGLWRNNLLDVIIVV